ncbi:hypothetical protein GBA63_08555 [Rubrobacter tropicus]|uniref:Uncharacterized protein n=1 Tax=Rubrobacter tropicus TaxID=2653851 RepID=A0A6G8Q8A9_9ACTN|nr:hypothetical protein GBA63_08555 [Rubrobacter tropicus]
MVESADADDVILIPVFIAEGWHTRETIPEDLGLTGEVTHLDGKRVFYGAPSAPTLDGEPHSRPRPRDGATGCLRPPRPARPSPRGSRRRKKRAASSARCFSKPPSRDATLSGTSKTPGLRG